MSRTRTLTLAPTQLYRPLHHSPPPITVLHIPHATEQLPSPKTFRYLTQLLAALLPLDLLAGHPRRPPPGGSHHEVYSSQRHVDCNAWLLCAVQEHELQGRRKTLRYVGTGYAFLRL